MLISSARRRTSRRARRHEARANIQLSKIFWRGKRGYAAIRRGFWGLGKSFRGLGEALRVEDQAGEFGG